MTTEITTHFPLLSVLLWLPIAGAVLCLASYRSAASCRWLALATTSIVFAVSVAAGLSPAGADGWIYFEDLSWIEPFGIRYTLGMDGISLLLVMLTAFLQVVAPHVPEADVISSTSSKPIMALPQRPQVLP